MCFRFNYDSDVTPEGIAFNYAAGNISYHAGHFIIGEATGDDAQLASLQFVADVSDNLTVGSSFYRFSNMENAYETPENKKAYNTTNEFELIEFFATYKIESTPLPLKIFVNYVENGAVDDANTAYMVGVEQNQVNGDLITTTVRSSLTPSMMSGLILISMMVEQVVKGINLKLNMPLKMVFHSVRLIF